MSEKNHIRINKRGTEIDIHIVCTSETIAEKLMNMFESISLKGIRVDLEREWQNNQGDNQK